VFSLGVPGGWLLFFAWVATRPAMSHLDAEEINVTTVRIPKKKLMESAKGIVLKLAKRDKPKKKKPSIYGSAGVYFLLK